MHNTARQNLEFQIAFTETNLRWQLGEEPRNETIIAKTQQKIKELKQELAEMPK